MRCSLVSCQNVEPQTPFFILRQLKETYLAQKRIFCFFAFVDLLNALDQVSRHVVWWTLRKPDVEECLVKTAQSMYRNVLSRGRINGIFGIDFLFLV